MSILLDEKHETRRDPKAMPQPVLVNIDPAVPDGTVCGIDPGNGPSHAFVHGGLIWLRRQSTYRVTFQLPDYPEFLFDPNDPIWSDQGGCPDNPCQDEQIQNPVVDENGLRLTVDVIPDGSQNAVHISLGWDNGNRFDPIVINN
jgi:hypothetical protein